MNVRTHALGIWSVTLTNEHIARQMHLLFAGGSRLAGVGYAIDLEYGSVVRTLHKHYMALAIVHGRVAIAYDHLFAVQAQSVLHKAIDDGEGYEVLAGEFLSRFLAPPEQQAVGLAGGEHHHCRGVLLVYLRAKLAAIHLQVPIAAERGIEAHLDVCTE